MRSAREKIKVFIHSFIILEVLALTLLLLSGLIDNLFNGQLIITAIVGSIYSLGSFALYIMGQCHSKRRSHDIMFASYLVLLIAYLCLEILFKEMYG